MIRVTHVFAGVCIVLFLFSFNTMACSCAPPRISTQSIDEIRNEKHNYFLYEFSGAAFIGKIVKREIVIVNWVAKTLTGEPTDSPMYRYTIHVKEYWLGVRSSTVIVYGELDGPVVLSNGNSYGWGSCGFKLNKGKTYFFTPRLSQNNLEIDMCDFAGGGSAIDESPATEFRKIMGEPKRF